MPSTDAHNKASTDRRRSLLFMGTLLSMYTVPWCGCYNCEATGRVQHSHTQHFGAIARPRDPGAEQPTARRHPPPQIYGWERSADMPARSGATHTTAPSNSDPYQIKRKSMQHIWCATCRQRRKLTINETGGAQGREARGRQDSHPGLMLHVGVYPGESVSTSHTLHNAIP